MPSLRSRWINVLAATVGGFLLGIGLVRLVHDQSLFAVVMAVGGVLVLWWAIADRRRYEPGNPESETDGKTTVE